MSRQTDRAFAAVAALVLPVVAAASFLPFVHDDNAWARVRRPEEAAIVLSPFVAAGLLALGSAIAAARRRGPGKWLVGLALLALGINLVGDCVLPAVLARDFLKSESSLYDRDSLYAVFFFVGIVVAMLFAGRARRAEPWRRWTLLLRAYVALAAPLAVALAVEWTRSTRAFEAGVALYLASLAFFGALAISFSVARAASTVRSISDGPCASETNAASNCDGAR